MFRKLADGLWEKTVPFRLMGMELTARMTVVQLSGGEVVVIAPVRLNPPTIKELDAIGPIRWIVAPNLTHHLFLPSYFSHFTHAEFLAAPGLAQKRKDLPFQGIVHDEGPAEWRGQLQPVLIRGMPKLNEVALVHIPSQTLILTDLVFNIRHSNSLWMTMFMRLNGGYNHFGPTRHGKRLIRNQGAVIASLARALAHRPNRVIMAHGQIVETGGTQLMMDAFAFLKA